MAALSHPIALTALSIAGSIANRISKSREEERVATERQREADAQMARQMAVSTFQQQQQRDTNDQSFNRDLVTQNYRTLVNSDNPGAAVPVAQGMGGLGAKPEVVQGLVGAAQQAQAGVEAERKRKQEVQLSANVVIALTQKGEWDQALGALQNVTDLPTRRQLAEQGVTHWMAQKNSGKAREWASAGGDRETLRYVDSWSEGERQKAKADREAAAKAEQELAVQDWMGEFNLAQPSQQAYIKLQASANQRKISGDPQVRAMLDQAKDWKQQATDFAAEQRNRWLKQTPEGRTFATTQDSLQAAAEAIPGGAKFVRANSDSAASAAGVNMTPLTQAQVASGDTASLYGPQVAANLSPEKRAAAVAASGGGQSLFPEEAVPPPIPRRIISPSPAAADTVGLSQEEIDYVQAQASKYGISFKEARNRLQAMVKP